MLSELSGEPQLIDALSRFYEQTDHIDRAEISDGQQTFLFVQAASWKQKKSREIGYVFGHVAIIFYNR